MWYFNHTHLFLTLYLPSLACFSNTSAKHVRQSTPGGQGDCTPVSCQSKKRWTICTFHDSDEKMANRHLSQIYEQTIFNKRQKSIPREPATLTISSLCKPQRGSLGSISCPLIRSAACQSKDGRMDLWIDCWLKWILFTHHSRLWS